MAENHLKKCLTFLAIGEMQNQNDSDSTLHLSRRLGSKTQVTAYTGKAIEQGEHFFADGSANLYSHFYNQYDSFSENWELTYLKPQLCHSWAYTQRMLHHTARTLAQLCS